MGTRRPKKQQIIVRQDTIQQQLADKVDVESIYVYDGGSVFVYCSNCNAPLAELWITRPEMQIKSEVVAECPHCGDKSYITELYGKFHLGQTDYTSIINQALEIETLEDGMLVQKILLKTVKGDKAYEK